jgi:hypothetical protein
MSDSPEAINEAPEVAADDVEKTRPYGRRNPDAWIEERQRRLFLKQLSGQSARALVYEHATREGVSVSTAWRDYAVVQSWNETDWQAERDKTVSRIQQMRLRCIDGAIRAKQFGTAQLLLRDLGAVVGEVSPEMLAQTQAPSLSIVVEDKRNGTAQE